jgi:hypothetical protein
MESDYAYRLCAVIWARCLMEWARVCNTPAVRHAGSSPAAPIRRWWHRAGGIKGIILWAVRLLVAVVRRIVALIVWVMETPLFPYRP